VKNLTDAQRAVSIASTIGKTVNLLTVDVPAADAQILLKVRFASVDRSASTELGLNLASTGATNTIGTVTTQQFTPPRVQRNPDGTTELTLSDALNIFLLRPDLNLAATIRALQRKLLLEVLAEPNVLAINGKQASFLAGGEFPFPMLQGGAGGVGQITVQFREFGIRLNFIPTLTPRGTIRLQVAPEVSALDFANGLNIQGFQIPALTVRRVNTEVELEAGQSFAIGGLLDNRMTETLSKMPLLGDIPLLGKLFQSKAANRQNTELLVIVTPELVRPIAAGQAVPAVNFPKEFLPANTKTPMRTPGMDVTGPVPVNSPTETLPIETLIESQKPGAPLTDVKGTSAPTQQPLLFAPTIVSPPGAASPASAPVAAPAPAAAK
jgi:pilus assembly protein CpaC